MQVRLGEKLLFAGENKFNHQHQQQRPPPREGTTQADLPAGLGLRTLCWRRRWPLRKRRQLRSSCFLQTGWRSLSAGRSAPRRLQRTSAPRRPLRAIQLWCSARRRSPPSSVVSHRQICVALHLCGARPVTPWRRDPCGPVTPNA